LIGAPVISAGLTRRRLAESYPHMIVSDIRRRITGGFQPFLIRTSDGREFKVPHPGFIIVGKHSVAVVDEEGDINTIAFLHIRLT